MRQPSPRVAEGRGPHRRGVGGHLSDQAGGGHARGWGKAGPPDPGLLVLPRPDRLHEAEGDAGAGVGVAPGGGRGSPLGREVVALPFPSTGR